MKASFWAMRIIPLIQISHFDLYELLPNWITVDSIRLPWELGGAIETKPSKRFWSPKWNTMVYLELIYHQQPTPWRNKNPRCNGLGKGLFLEWHLQTHPLKKFIQRQLQTNIEITKLSIARTDFIKAHFVDDIFDVLGVVSKQSDSPFHFVETSGASD